MNNKAFTLIELVAIIALLGIIFLITYTEVNKSLEKSQTQLDKVQESNIKAATKNWTVDNLDKLPEESKRSCNVSLNTLQEGGYIGKVMDPKAKKNEISDIYVTITKITKENNKENSNYIYKVVKGASDTTCGVG